MNYGVGQVQDDSEVVELHQTAAQTARSESDDEFELQFDETDHTHSPALPTTAISTLDQFMNSNFAHQVYSNEKHSPQTSPRAQEQDDDFFASDEEDDSFLAPPPLLNPLRYGQDSISSDQQLSEVVVLQPPPPRRNIEQQVVNRESDAANWQPGQIPAIRRTSAGRQRQITNSRLLPPDRSEDVDSETASGGQNDTQRLRRSQKRSRPSVDRTIEDSRKEEVERTKKMKSLLSSLVRKRRATSTAEANVPDQEQKSDELLLSNLTGNNNAQQLTPREERNQRRLKERKLAIIEWRLAIKRTCKELSFVEGLIHEAMEHHSNDDDDDEEDDDNDLA